MFPFDQSDQYFTMVYGLLDLAGGAGELRYVSAGHPGLIHVSASGTVTESDGRGFPVGLATGPYTEQVMPLRRGDRIYFYSDGVIEAMDDRARIFGGDRLLDALARRRGGGLGDSVEGLVSDVVSWAGGVGLNDDVSILAVEIGADLGVA